MIYLVMLYNRDGDQIENIQVNIPNYFPQGSKSIASQAPVASEKQVREGHQALECFSNSNSFNIFYTKLTSICSWATKNDRRK